MDTQCAQTPKYTVRTRVVVRLALAKIVKIHNPRFGWVSDMIGPITPPSRGGAKHVLTFIDGTSGYASIAFLQTKGEAFEKYLLFEKQVLENERPEEDAIRVHAAQKALRIKEELHAMAEELFKQRAISRVELLRRKMENDEMAARLRTAELSLKQSQKGRQQSIRIAEASVREAQLALAHREEELEDYKVYATVDGLVERCLIHEGEYNQEPGKPGFLILMGQWFEAHFDQTAIGKINVSDDAQVYLEAFASQPFLGKVTMVHPVVSFSLGGPETTRPLRATGTGAPEWPSTFSVRIEMDQSGPMTTVGLTGFARVTKIREGLAVPLGAVTSRSAGRGLVFVVQEGSFEPREVTLGFASDDWIEIRSGVDPGDEVIVDGHQVLQPDDRIVVESGPSADKRMIVRSS